MPSKVRDAIKKTVKTQDIKDNSLTPEQIAHRDAMEKFYRLAWGLGKFEKFFEKDSTAWVASRLRGFIPFLAVEPEGGSPLRMELYSFHKFFIPDGRARIAEWLENIREKMLLRSREIHLKYNFHINVEITRLTGELKDAADSRERRVLQQQMEALVKLLDIPGKLEITPRFYEGVVYNVVASSMVTQDRLNACPPGLIFRIQVGDCTAEGRFVDGKLRIGRVKPDPKHLLTHGVNASLEEPKLEEKSKLWYDFLVKAMGEQGSRRFLQQVGYAFVTQFPLPTERTVTMLLGNSNTGKGTTVGAVEKLFRVGGSVLYANANPQKLCDPREHFSVQNLQDKLLITNGDLPHKRIADMSPLNELTGGQTIEIEKKFHDPVTEIPIFKIFWASTYPLFRITVPGGFWRRVSVILMADVPQLERDNTLKTRLLEASNGLFYNALLGLSYLVANDWKFEGEISDDETEKLWNLYSDSVRVFADQYLIAEPGEIENDGKMVRNIAKEILLSEIYAKYQEYCRKSQIEPVKYQTFAMRMGSDAVSFEIKQERINDGEKSAKVLYATYLDNKINENENTNNENSKSKFEQDFSSWKAFVSQAPMILESRFNFHGQVTHMCARGKEENQDLSHACNMPSHVQTDISHAQNLGKYGSDMGSKSVRTLFQNPENQKTGAQENSDKTNAQNQQTTVPKEENHENLETEGPEENHPMDDIDRSVIETLQKAGKPLSVHEIYEMLPLKQKFLDLTESEIYKRLEDLAATHPNVKKTGIKFYWDQGHDDRTDQPDHPGSPHPDTNQSLQTDQTNQANGGDQTNHVDRTDRPSDQPGPTNLSDHASGAGDQPVNQTNTDSDQPVNDHNDLKAAGPGSPNSPGSPNTPIDLTTPEPTGLKAALIEYVRIHAPETMYHSLRPEDVYDKIKDQYNTTLQEVRRLMKEAYDAGFFVKQGPGYRYNGDGA